MSSSPPVTEIVTLQLGSNFSEDATKPLIEKLKKQPGCQDVYWGPTVEDANVAHLFIDWDSVGHHEDFRANEEASKPILGPLLEMLTGPAPLTYFHVPFEPFPPTKAMSGPILELGQLEAKDEPGAKEEMEKIVLKIFGLASKQPKCNGAALGTVVEDKNRIVILLAWESVEAHMKDFRNTPEFGEAAALLGPYMKEGAFTHVKIKRA